MRKNSFITLAAVFCCFALAFPARADDSDIPPIPGKFLELCGGIPDTIEEVQEGLLDSIHFDISQLKTIYEQCDFQNMFEEMKETGSCTIPVMGEEWFGDFQYIDENEEFQYMSLEFDQSEDQIMITRTEVFDFDKYLSWGLNLHCNIEDNLLGIDVMNYHNDEDGSDVLKPDVNISYDLANAPGSASICEVRYLGNEKYEVNLSEQTMSSMQFWIGVYDENGKLEKRDYSFF